MNPTHRFSYGPGEWQFGELRLPEMVGPHPGVILIHGGGWHCGTGLDYMRPAALHLTRRGFATFNLEYRRVGNPGGGLPGTLQDLLAATDEIVGRLAPEHGVDPRRIALLGHSSGGQLAVWLAGERPGLAGVVSLAGVMELEAQYRLREALGGSNYVRDFMGGSPEELPERYAALSPIHREPPAMPVVLLHGEADWRVPISQSAAYLERLTARGGQGELIRLPGIDHVEIFNPRLPVWQEIAGALDRLTRSATAGLPVAPTK